MNATGRQCYDVCDCCFFLPPLLFCPIISPPPLSLSLPSLPSPVSLSPRLGRQEWQNLWCLGEVDKEGERGGRGGGGGERVNNSVSGVFSPGKLPTKLWVLGIELREGKLNNLG